MILWHIDGNKFLNEQWRGSTRFLILNKRPTQVYSCVDGRQTKNTKSHRGQKRFGQKCGHPCPNVLKRRQWDVEKPNIAARQMTEI